VKMRLRNKIVLLLFLSLQVTTVYSHFFGTFRESLAYRLDYQNYNNENHSLLFTLGLISGAPTYFYNQTFLNFGFGELWRGKEKEFVFNFSFFKLKSEEHINVYEKSHLPYSDMSIGFDFTRYSLIQFGFDFIDYIKNLEYVRKIKWLGFSSELIFDKRNWKGHYWFEEYDIEKLKFQSKLSVNIGLSNIIYSDLFSKFENSIHNNNFGLEAGTDCLLGFLLNNNFFAGITGCYRGFYTKNTPFTELELGAKVYYIIEIEKLNRLFSRSIGIFIDYSRNYFNYSSEEMNFYKFQIGIQLFDFYGFEWAR
jgi:hypothetical protein